MIEWVDVVGEGRGGTSEGEPRARHDGDRVRGGLEMKWEPIRGACNMHGPCQHQAVKLQAYQNMWVRGMQTCRRTRNMELDIRIFIASTYRK